MKSLLVFFFTLNVMAQTCEEVGRAPAIIDDTSNDVAEISSRLSNRNFDLFEAIEDCNPKKISKALKRGADVNATNDSYTGQTKRYTALTFAVKMGCFDAAKILLENNANVDDARSIDNNTALMVAARQNKSAIAKLLLDYKADVNAGTAFERSALNIASWNNSIEVAKLIMSRPDVNLNINPKIARNALGSALFMGNSEIVDLILNHSPEIKPMNEETIRLASKWAKSEEMKVRLQKYLDIQDLI